ncbi:MAG: helix-turn-helix domain-containing protein [Elusimicrobiota bacterium]
MVITLPENKRLFSPEELAGYLSVSTKTVYKWVFFKKVPCVKIGRTLRFDKSEIDLWIDSLKKSTNTISMGRRANNIMSCDGDV